MSWRPPEMPKVQKPPRARPPRKPSIFGRAVAGIAGVAFGFTALAGLARALRDNSGQVSPFASLALLIPAALLVRYALTGEIKLS
jgi:hypothetical protein